MTDAAPYRRTDLMGGQDDPSDLMERGREPAGSDPDLLRGGREPAGTDPDLMSGRDGNPPAA